MSNVIKNYGETESGGKAERFEMSEIEADRQEILATAREQAAASLEQARLDAESIREEAYQQGWETGRSEASMRLEDEIRRELNEKYGRRVEELVSMLRQVTSALDGRREPLVKTTRNELLKLAVRIAEVIVKKEVKVPGEVAALNLEECIRRSARRTELVALVNQQDLETLKQVLPEMQEIAGPGSSVKLVADAKVTPGGCLVKSQSGEVDATVETQLGEIERILLGEGSDR